MTIEVGGGGGGLLKLVAFDSGRVNTGASGDIISVTAGADQYLKLTYLMCRFSTLETGITLTINGIGIFTNGVLADTTPVTYQTPLNYLKAASYALLLQSQRSLAQLPKI